MYGIMNLIIFFIEIEVIVHVRGLRYVTKRKLVSFFDLVRIEVFRTFYLSRGLSWSKHP